MGAELSMRVDLDQLLLTARLLAVKVGHVLLRLGADLGAAAAHVVSTQHVLHHGTEGGRRSRSQCEIAEQLVYMNLDKKAT